LPVQTMPGGPAPDRRHSNGLDVDRFDSGDGHPGSQPVMLGHEKHRRGGRLNEERKPRPRPKHHNKMAAICRKALGRLCLVGGLIWRGKGCRPFHLHQNGRGVGASAKAECGASSTRFLAGAVIRDRQHHFWQGRWDFQSPAARKRDACGHARGLQDRAGASRGRPGPAEGPSRGRPAVFSPSETVEFRQFFINGPDFCGRWPITGGPQTGDPAAAGLHILSALRQGTFDRGVKATVHFRGAGKAETGISSILGGAMAHHSSMLAHRPGKK